MIWGLFQVNGIAMSNTLMFEHKYGWTGVLIEANPDMFKTLIYNRPAATCVRAAICHKKQIVHYSRSSSVGMRGILEFMKPAHIHKWLYPKDNEQKKAAVWGHAIKTMCLPLTGIFDEIDFPRSADGRWHIDWWSLDVEGAELEVIQGVNFKRFKFSVINVEAQSEEHLSDSQNKNEAVRELLRYNNYTWHSNDGTNDWFHHNTLNII